METLQWHCDGNGAPNSRRAAAARSRDLPTIRLARPNSTPHGGCCATSVAGRRRRNGNCALGCLRCGGRPGGRGRCASSVSLRAHSGRQTTRSAKTTTSQVRRRNGRRRHTTLRRRRAFCRTSSSNTERFFATRGLPATCRPGAVAATADQNRTQLRVAVNRRRRSATDLCVQVAARSLDIWARDCTGRPSGALPFPPLPLASRSIEASEQLLLNDQPNERANKQTN